MLVTLALTSLLARGLAPPAQAQSEFPLRLRSTGQERELFWPSQPASPGATTAWIFELQHSADLQTWTPIGGRLTSSSASADGLIRQPVVGVDPYGFFRLWAVPRVAAAPLAQDGAGKFGFTRALAEELSRLGRISAAEFANRYASPAAYLPAVSVDPTAARYWDAFAADIEQLNRGKSESEPGYRHTDYRLNAAEFELFRKNGFVVSERLDTAPGSRSSASSKPSRDGPTP